MPRKDAWFSELVGSQAAEVLTRYAVPCLHYAHFQAGQQFRRATWTNDMTYGYDRYHCLCDALGQVCEDCLPDVEVRRPTERPGTPFSIRADGWVCYVYHYGKDRSDPAEGTRPRNGRGFLSGVPEGDGIDQGALELELPGLVDCPPHKVVALAWAGNRYDGLCRAFTAVPRPQNGLIYWEQDKFLELDVTRARRGLAASPHVNDIDMPQLRPFSLHLLDDALVIDDKLNSDS